MKLTSPLAPVAASFIATAVFIALNGYAFGGSTQRLPGTSPSSDHANVLPQVYREYDSALFSKDPQILSGATFKTALWPIIGRLCPPHRVNWAFFLLQVVCTSASFWLVWRLAVECGGGVFAGLFAVILLVVIRISPAAEPTLDTAFYTRGAALPLGLAAILLILRNRSAWAAVMIVFAAGIHAITALQVLCVCLPLALISPGPVRRNRRILMLALGMAMAAVGWLFATKAMLQVLWPGEAWIAMQRAVNGSHLFVDLIPQGAWREFAVGVLFLLPALAQPVGDPLRRLASASLLGAMASVLLGLAAQISETAILLQLSPLRGLKLSLILSMISAAVIAARHSEMIVLPDISRSARVAAIVGSAALLALVGRQHYLAIGAFTIVTIFSDGPRSLRAISLIVAGGLAVWFGGVDFARGLNDVPRATWIIGAVVAAGMAVFAIVASRVERVIDSHDRASGGGVRPGPLLVSLAALGLLTIPAQRDDVWVYAARDYPWREPSDPLREPPDPWAEAQGWVEKNTPVDSLFLVPPWLEGFRTYARRSEFVEYKMGTLSLFHPAFGQEWAGRMAQLTPRQLSGDGYEDMAMNYSALTPGEISAIVERYGITHVMVMASRDDLPYRTVYQNALFRVLDTAR